MNVTINSFTRTLPSIANEIITECGVSLPHRPGMGEHPTVLHTKGLWDTGATGCVITKRLATQLGLTPIGKTQTHHAGGTSTVNVYLVNIILTNNVGFPFIKVTECEETVGRFDIIIGMDLITRGDFAISNSGGQTTVSFRTH